MINNEQTYEELGKRAHDAMKYKNDAALYLFHKNCFTRAMRMEPKEDQPIARAAYERGYKGE